MNNQSLVGHKNAVCFSNQEDNFEAGYPDDIELNDDLQIDILLGDMLNSTQDQDNDGHSQLDTPTLSQLSNRTPQFFIIHQYTPSLKLSNHSILMPDYQVVLYFKWNLPAYVIVIEQT
jgi:hypothetical protein